ncbi:MAG: geranylgeranylglycerol-phosphate geranylgeranyltransferase [Chitinophagaceae bacterium]|nr:geranylgeranylglycerol-phosphate geranylgeranyltransferase [Chitinophagaceae bacterium]
MRKLNALITIIRLPNLVFIFLTQILAWHCILKPAVLSEHQLPTLSTSHLLWLAFSTVLIAAAGYIINDYFDIGIDTINKPERVTIEKIFKRRSIIIWHILLNVIALMIAGYIAFYEVKLRVLIFQIISIFLLLVYSSTFKRKLIIGNIIIALLTALTLLSLAFYEPHFNLLSWTQMYMKRFWIYVIFAFSITWIREIVKDIEDVKGDLSQNCQTIPLVWGINKAKQVVYALISILLLLLVITIIRYYEINTALVIFLGIGVCLPLIYVFYLLVKAIHASQFHRISTYIKIITLLGILSMMLI